MFNQHISIWPHNQESVIHGAKSDMYEYKRNETYRSASGGAAEWYVACSQSTTDDVFLKIHTFTTAMDRNDRIRFHSRSSLSLASHSISSYTSNTHNTHTHERMQVTTF